MRTRSTLLLLLPFLAFMTAFMLGPLLLAIGFSFMTPDPHGGVSLPLSFDAYVRILFERDFDDTLLFTWDYLIIVFRSIALAVATTVICLVLGLPVAWYIVTLPRQKRLVVLFAVTMPFWINLLIRTYCWVLILRDEGILNGLLSGMGLIASPLPLLYSNGAILVGLVYTFLPFMVLPLYAAFEKLDPTLFEAAFDLYASRIAVAREIAWPLVRPGALAGSILVFAPALGSFLAPDLLGGGRKLLIGSLMQMQFTSSRNWAFGSALAVTITLFILLVMAIQMLRFRSSGAKG